MKYTMGMGRGCGGQGVGGGGVSVTVGIEVCGAEVAEATGCSLVNSVGG